MNRCKGLMVFLGSLILAVLAFPKTSYAYLDPGSGSYIIQLILAGLLAVSFALKSFWGQAKQFVKNLFSRKKRDERTSD